MQERVLGSCVLCSWELVDVMCCGVRRNMQTEALGFWVWVRRRKILQEENGGSVRIPSMRWKGCVKRYIREAGNPSPGISFGEELPKLQGPDAKRLLVGPSCWVPPNIQREGVLLHLEPPPPPINFELDNLAPSPEHPLAAPNRLFAYHPQNPHVARDQEAPASEVKPPVVERGS